MAIPVNIVPMDAPKNVLPGNKGNQNTNDTKSKGDFTNALTAETGKVEPSEKTEKSDNNINLQTLLGAALMPITTNANVMPNPVQTESASGKILTNMPINTALAGKIVITTPIALSTEQNKGDNQQKELNAVLAQMTPVKPEIAQTSIIPETIQQAVENSKAMAQTVNQAIVPEVLQAVSAPVQVKQNASNLDVAKSTNNVTPEFPIMVDKVNVKGNSNSKSQEQNNASTKNVEVTNVQNPDAIIAVQGKNTAEHDSAKNLSEFITIKEAVIDKDKAPAESTDNNSNSFASILTNNTIKPLQTLQHEVKAAAPQPIADPHNIGAQIIEQARLVNGKQNSEMIIQLKPEHLGELTFKVTVENGVVSASFHSNNAEVRNVIESSLQQLKTDLNNQGLKVNDVGVYAGLGQFFSDGQREGYQKPTVKVKNKKAEQDFVENIESIGQTELSTPADGVDYRI